MSLDKELQSLLNKNIVIVNGVINDNKVGYVKEVFGVLHAKGSPDITVLIDSPGGTVSCGMDIYDLLMLYPAKKTGLVVCAAQSIATIILQACEERLATPYAKILVHNMAIELSLDTFRDEVKLKKKINELEIQQTKQYELCAKRCKKSIEEVRSKFAEDKNITAEEAVIFGLLDGIWNKPLPN